MAAFFGESLPHEEIDEAMERAARCDCLLAVGTTELVYPATLVPEAAASGGAAGLGGRPSARFGIIGYSTFSTGHITSVRLSAGSFTWPGSVR